MTPRVRPPTRRRPTGRTAGTAAGTAICGTTGQSGRL
jgi:hypothetical protein